MAKVTITNGNIFNEMIDEIYEEQNQYMEYVRKNLGSMAPRGVPFGDLQQSFNIEIDPGPNKITGVIFSDLPYAHYQDENVLLHVPQGQIGKAAFSDSAYSDALRGTRQTSRNDPAVYARGYYYATTRGGGEEYQTNYIEKSVDAAGGDAGLKARIEGRISKGVK